MLRPRELDPAAEIVDLTEITSDVIAQQAGQEIQEETLERDYPVQFYGYFNGYLKADSGWNGFYPFMIARTLTGPGPLWEGGLYQRSVP